MSAHIAIRCKCGIIRLGDEMNCAEDLFDEIIKATSAAEANSWEVGGFTGNQVCPFCAARRKAREKVEADARA
jgi:hypothetical protein